MIIERNGVRLELSEDLDGQGSYGLKVSENSRCKSCGQQIEGKVSTSIHFVPLLHYLLKQFFEGLE